MRTIFLYGYGTGLTGRQPWWDAPWIEPPWLDNGRLEFRRDHAPSVENLYHEAAAIATISGLAPVLRGAQDIDGFASLTLFRRVVEAHTFPFAEHGQTPPTFSPFIDTGSWGDVVSVAAGHNVPFDFARQIHRELIWTMVLKPFFDVFAERHDDALNPIRHERTPNGRRLVTFWKIAPEVCRQGLVNQGAAQLLLDYLSQQMQDAGLGEPDFIVDTTWPADVHAYSKHDWYRPEHGESWTVFNHRGVVTGVAVPGFHDPPWSSVHPARIVSRRNGGTLREGLAHWRAAGAQYGFLESLTNIEESAGFYRSPLWDDLYLRIVREHVELE